MTNRDGFRGSNEPGVSSTYIHQPKAQPNGGNPSKAKPFDGTPYVQDTDFTLYVGDVREVLAELPDESVQCVVTSPPYWGLRDYGTGSWTGGDPDCDHVVAQDNSASTQRKSPDGRGGTVFRSGSRYIDQPPPSRSCKCGAARTDQQLGLEPTPELYVENMVAVFREVRRVLRRDGTLWLNIGDSYASQGGPEPAQTKWQIDGASATMNAGRSRTPGALKPKDLVGVPWRLAFGLQADGWYLRSEIIWSKPNPMPESVTDRPTKSHEQVFLLTRSPRYFFDQEAVREPAIYPGEQLGIVRGTKRRASANGRGSEASGNESLSRSYALDAVVPEGGRNIRSVWEIPTQPFSEAHFATYPQALVERCVKAGCPEWVCGTCGKPRERIVERTKPPDEVKTNSRAEGLVKGGMNGQKYQNWAEANPAQTLGFTDCGHNDYQPGVVLDPFLGSGTTALVARRLGRRSVGIELNPEYADMAAKRLSQLSLLA